MNATAAQTISPNGARDSIVQQMIVGRRNGTLPDDGSETTHPHDHNHTWSMAELLAAEFPEPQWAVPGIVPVGLAVLAGRPKLGKSWLALQIAVAVGTGGHALGQQVQQGKVLYLALEDGPKRLQDRLHKQHASAMGAVDFRFTWEPLTGQGAVDLMIAFNQNQYTLIVIDTISRALGRADQMDLRDMNMTMGTLQRLALEKAITILLVDHHRKGADGDGDPIDDIMGSTGKAGVADAALGIYRKRGQKDATLKVTGRDMDDKELSIKFDHDTGSWQLLGESGAIRASTVQADIIIAIQEHGGTATAGQIAKWLGKLPNNITRELAELVAKGIVRRGEKAGKQVPYSIIDTDDTGD